MILTDLFRALSLGVVRHALSRRAAAGLQVAKQVLKFCLDLAARAEAQADSDSRCGGCLCCCGPRPDVLVEHEAQREARIAAHRGVLPGLEPDAGEA